MKKLILISIFILTLSFIGCSDSQETTEKSTTSVKVVLKSPEFLSGSVLSASGTVHAVEQATISTRLMGYVEKSFVKTGNKVKKGDLLLRINNADLLAQHAQSKAGITEALTAYNNIKKDYNRYQILFETQSVSQKEMDDMTANLKMAEARLNAVSAMKNQINAQMQYSDIRAPFSGTITNTFINEGDMANPGMPLMNIENPKRLHVEAMIPESKIVKISQGMTASVTIKSTGELVFGTVTEVSTSGQHTGGQYLVKVLLEEKESSFLPGMFASLQFPLSQGSETENEKQTLVIDKNAIVTRGQLSGVYVMSNANTAILRWLRLGKSFGNQVEVLSGLNESEKYILQAEGKLYNGVELAVN